MKTYIVLGMHRSATSFVSSCLEKGGADMGRKSKGRYEGLYENQEFLHLNRDILKEAGGSWKNPPSREKILQVARQYRGRIKSLINKYQGEYWGFKDPRSALTIEAYLPYLKGDIYLICLFRKPDRIAKSLVDREGLTIQEGIKLTKEYNRRILAVIKRFYEPKDSKKTKTKH